MKKLLVLLLISISLNIFGANIHGDLKVWHRVILDFEGPTLSELSTPNPFTDYRLDIEFIGPTGQTYKVPGFFAADGNSSETSANKGNVWRVKFCPDMAGDWKYSVSFVSDQNIAVELTGGASAGYFDGETGFFNVSPSDKTAPDFRAKGTLQYTGGHYFQFAETKEHFLKGGADSPENFLAYE